MVSDHLSDEDVARLTDMATEGVESAETDREADAAIVIGLLAREVQDSRRILAAIRALPDDPPPDRHLNTTTPTFGYRYAMRQVKALLDGAS